ncbi:MAG: DUF975 family protein [Peptostreptococcaceae bacterium]
MYTRAELKSNAKQQLKGKWGLAVLTCLVYTLIIQGTLASSGGSAVYEGGGIYIGLNLLGWIIYGPISVGLCIFTLNLVKNKENAKFTDLFSGFKLILKALIITLLFNIAMFIGYMLFIIPGVIAGLMFSQAYYVLTENPELSAIECLKRSASMMKGHKMELFVLGLSFIGWLIVCVLTFGIGYLWYTPYYQMTMANFYLNIKGE